MKNLYILSQIEDFTLVTDGVLTNLIYVEYNLPYGSIGEFIVQCKLNDNNLGVVSRDSLVFFEEDIVGIIESIEKDSDKGLIIITGRMAEALLARRSTKETFEILTPTNLGSLLGTIFSHVASLGIKYINISPAYPISGTIYPNNLLDIFTSLCGEVGYWFKVRLNSQRNGLELYVYKGIDRSIDSGNSPILMSPEYLSLERGKSQENTREIYNAYCIRYGEGQLSTFYLNDARVDGINRREYFEDNKGKLYSESELKSKAKKFFKNQQEKTTYTALTTESIYKFGVDYDLGDTVTVFDKTLKIQLPYQVTNVKVTSSSQGEKIQATLGYPQNNLLSVLKELTYGQKMALKEATYGAIGQYMSSPNLGRGVIIGSVQNLEDHTVGDNSVSWGQETQATGENATARGRKTKATGYCSSAGGESTQADGMYSTVEGYNNQIEGFCSSGLGSNNTLSSKSSSSLVSGDQNSLDSDYSLMIGFKNSLTGGNSDFVSGADNVCTELYQSGVFGSRNTPQGTANLVGGTLNETGGANNIVAGLGLQTLGSEQAIFGEYNEPLDAIFILGNGSGANNRKNALWVTRGGDLHIQGNLITSSGSSGSSFKVGEGINLNPETQEIYLKSGSGLSLELSEDLWKLSVNLGEGLELGDNNEINVIGGGGVNIESAVIIQEAEAQYVLHNFTETKYIDGNRIGYAGEQNQIIAQGYVIYRYGGTAPNGVKVGTIQNTDVNQLPDLPMYTDMQFPRETCYIQGSWRMMRAYAAPQTVYPTYTAYSLKAVKEDGTNFGLANFNNYSNYRYGVSFVWTSIQPPGYTTGGVTFPYGCAICSHALRYKSSATMYQFIVPAGSYYAIGFASQAEYDAAVGLTYEPLNLYAVNDTLESKESSGQTNTTINTGDSYVSPTVNLVKQEGGVLFTVTDVLGTHSYFIPDGSSVTKTSQLINDSGFVVKKEGIPYNIIAVPGDESVTLAWDKMLTAERYRVQQLKDGSWVTLAYPYANSYRVTGLTADTEYSFRVLAYIDGTWGKVSDPVYATPFSPIETLGLTQIDEYEGELETT